MKKVIMVVFIITILSLSSCKWDNETIIASQTETTSNTLEAINVSSTETISNTLEEYLHVNLPQLQRENQRLYYVEWGKLSKASHTDSVLILSDIQYANNLQSDVYMVADVGGNVIVQELGIFDKMVIQNGNLSLADIDGDDVDEIVVHFEISGNGATLTHVYKVENGSIILLSDLDEFNTGFTSEYENDYKLRIINKNTGYMQEVNISKCFTSDAFDKNGKAIIKEGIFVQQFSSCEVKDEDKNGKFELLCSQDVKLTGGYIGEVHTMLQYSSETSRFEVNKSEFIEK